MLQVALRSWGWQPDVPDWRDLTCHDDPVRDQLRGLRPIGELPTQVDWREYSHRVEELAGIPSSVAACVELLEHYERRALGQRMRLSKWFVTQTATRLAAIQSSSAVSLRSVWKAIVKFGIPAVSTMPDPSDLVLEPKAAEPDAFDYAIASNYSQLLYARLAPREAFSAGTVESLRSHLAAGFSFVCGIPISTSTSPDGDIGFPTRFDVMRGGQAVVVLGYDDDHRIRSDRGCFLVRGCWGERWGDRGYGWLPYRYVHQHLVTDFWMILHPEWLPSGEFAQP